MPVVKVSAPATVILLPKIAEVLADLVVVKLLKVALLTARFWFDVPFKTRVPLPWLKVPAVKVISPETFMILEGKVSEVPFNAMDLKEVGTVEPLTVEVPLKVTVPLLWVKVPLLTKLPATLIEGEFKVPVTVILLKLVVEVPEMAEVPLKLTKALL